MKKVKIVVEFVEVEMVIAVNNIDGDERRWRWW